MASLRHPNLLAGSDMLMDEDDLLLVMEYAAAGRSPTCSLRHRWAGRARWSCSSRSRPPLTTCTATASCIAT